MSTHDYVLANQVGSDARSDLNLLFQAIVSQNSSATEPATMYAYMFWNDTSLTPPQIKQRNAANSAWEGVSVAPATTGTMAVQGSQLRGWNDIVNGDFRIDQLDIATTPVTVSNVYDLDGWKAFFQGGAVLSTTRVAGSSSGKYARQTTVTTAETSIAVGDLVIEQTKIEGSNIVKYVGNTFTVGFRAKFPVTGIHCIALGNSDADRSYIVEINCLVANTWGNYSFTVIGGLSTAGTWNYTNGVGLRISFCHAAGSTSQTTAETWQTGGYFATANQVNDCATIGNVWALEDVTISLGYFVIPSNVSYEEELARCQRYYNSMQFYVTTSSAPVQTAYPVEMMAAPTISGGGAGFTNTGGTLANKRLICSQTTAADQTLIFSARL